MTHPADLSPPPAAEQRPYSYERHGVTIEDPWHWLRDPKYPEVDDPDVLAYLKAENAYFDGWKVQHQGLLDTLFKEMKGRIKEDDRSVPLRDGDWMYWWAFTPGAQYRTWWRKPARGGADEVLFDEPAEAKGKDYFRLGALEVSPDGKLLATLVDDNGSERFQLRIRDLATGKDIETVTEVGIGQPVWTSGSRIDFVSGARRYGCSSATSSSWYTDSALTAQMSWSAPLTMLSTARIAVSIEWSELLYRCRPLRPTCWRLVIVSSHSRIASTRSA